MSAGELRSCTPSAHPDIENEEQKGENAMAGVKSSKSGEVPIERMTTKRNGRDESPPHDHAAGGVLGKNTELVLSLACGFLLAIGFGIEKLGNPSSHIRILIFVSSYAFGGYTAAREVVENIRGKRLQIDSLMLVAAVGAAALGEWAEGALLLFLFSLGHALESFAMNRARRSIEALSELTPKIATVRRDSETRDVPVGEIIVGDVVVVKPNSRIPADGFLIEGKSSIDQSPITGESISVDKSPVPDAAAARARPENIETQSQAFAGTINGAGAIALEVTRLAADSTLSRIVKMVTEAESVKSPSQRFADRFEKIFVPGVFALVCTLVLVGLFMKEPFNETFYRAMAVLVAASPCALAIATPSAVLSGVARAARGGVLIKGGASLESLGTITAIAFDKTGTLTEGRPHISDVVPDPNVSEKELLQVAVAVEQLSDHPLAKAIVRDGMGRLDGVAKLAARSLESRTGFGVRAMIDEEPVWIGKAEMFRSPDAPALSEFVIEQVERLRTVGRTTMVVHRGTRTLGVIGLMDTPRSTATATLQRLRSIGMRKLIMVSGDHRSVAQAVGSEIGIDEVWGDLLPEEKVSTIRNLGVSDVVAMVGDGVNDAPAMAAATVGIAMGAAGSDVALETASVALMADDLTTIPFIIGLGRRTRGIIRQNLVVSLGVVAVLLPATIAGVGIGTAVAVHEGSTILVVFNALRLLSYRGTSS